MYHSDHALRIAKLQAHMREMGAEALVIASNVNLYYLFGQIYSGIAYIPQEGVPTYLVRRPQVYEGIEHVRYVRKIEELQTYIKTSEVSSVALELDELSYSDIQRQQALFPSAKLINGSNILRRARMIKTALEIEMIRRVTDRHMHVYAQVPKLYRSGMTDIELQIEIEHEMRQNGSVGVFRTFGSAMEIYMGSLLAGDNALTASPYDFAMGGAGCDALPLGSNGTRLQTGMSVMVDMAGNYSPYLTDVTRTFSVGKLTDEAYRLHELSRTMHREVIETARLGIPCSEIYAKCMAMAQEHGAVDYFMGYGQRAQFVGHGLGLQINELPVLTARSSDILQEGMIIAFEPKFVIPHVGAVGVENTYLITSYGVENLTPLQEAIINLED